MLTVAANSQPDFLTVYEFLNRVWYERHPAGVLMAPLALLYRGVMWLRRKAFQTGLVAPYRAPVPVVVVGNLSVGGTGKTPLVIWLADYLKSLGYKPGIISRGYKGKAKQWPQQVRADGDPAIVGDEAIVIARRTRLPLAVGPSRAENIQALLKHANCDIVISDDGLQHYRMARDVEILLVDGVRRFGNGKCLPAGPLREPLSRLRDVDLLVNNGIAGRGEFKMEIKAAGLYPVGKQHSPLALTEFVGQAVNAVAGIGNPDKFFDMLRSAGLRVVKHAFPDHHSFEREDLKFEQSLPIIMTEKDAVKCERFKLENAWYLPIEVEMPQVFEHRLRSALEGVKNG